MNHSSKLIKDAVEAFATLPGIGKKSALRLVLHVLDKDVDFTNRLTTSIKEVKEKIKFCKYCFNVSDEDVCSICKSHSRDEKTLCIVESIRDVMAIEDTGQYNGRYHVLGGVISPIDGVGPDELTINDLVERVKTEKIKEVIMAVSPTIEGETTIYYISKRLKNQDVNVSVIARGVSFGGELEYADEITLGRSILSRLPYD